MTHRHIKKQLTIFKAYFQPFLCNICELLLWFSCYFYSLVLNWFQRNIFFSYIHIGGKNGLANDCLFSLIWRITSELFVFQLLFFSACQFCCYHLLNIELSALILSLNCRLSSSDWLNWMWALLNQLTVKTNCAKSLLKRIYFRRSQIPWLWPVTTVSFSKPDFG